VPLQSNFNSGVGPDNDMVYLLNVQPVIPTELNGQWNLIARAILPVIAMPELAPGVGEEFGLGDLQFTTFLSPAKPSGLIWGVGPVFRFPTATDKELGSEKWSVGPSAVVLNMDGPWVYGALA